MGAVSLSLLWGEHFMRIFVWIIVQVQKQTRLCITRDLTEKDVVSRIMRKENYLIGMLNKASVARGTFACYCVMQKLMT